MEDWVVWCLVACHVKWPQFSCVHCWCILVVCLTRKGCNLYFTRVMPCPEVNLQNFLPLQIIKVYVFPSRRISSAICSECSTFDWTTRLSEVLQLFCSGFMQGDGDDESLQVSEWNSGICGIYSREVGIFLCRMVSYWVLTWFCSSMSQHNRLTAALIKLVGAASHDTAILPRHCPAPWLISYRISGVFLAFEFP